MTINEKFHIRNRSELKYRIMKLKAKREDQELEMRKNLKELYYSLHPGELFRNTVHNLFGDSLAVRRLVNLGLTGGASFLIGKLLKRHSSGLKGFLHSFLLKKAANYVIKKYSPAFFGRQQHRSDNTDIQNRSELIYDRKMDGEIRV